VESEPIGTGRKSVRGEPESQKGGEKTGTRPRTFGRIVKGSISYAAVTSNRINRENVQNIMGGLNIIGEKEKRGSRGTTM